MPSRPAERTRPAPRRLIDLAAFGGAPAFDEPLHVGRPNVGNKSRLLERIGEAVDQRWLTNDGVMVGELEERLAELTDAKNCVAVSNATLGIQLAARALGLTGEVIVPSFTFVASAHALTWIGLEPVFCDIDVETHNIDPSHAERLIGERTSAILGVHLWGRPCEAEALAALADAHGVGLFFDAAHALGCSDHGRPLACVGDAAVFSLHATKVASSGEGGVITTDDDDVARRLRLMRNFGFVGYDTVEALGTNAKMNELSAAMGLTSLDSFAEFVAANRRNHRCYADALDGLDEVRLLDHAPGNDPNYHYVVLEVPAPVRDRLVTVLHAENVLARRYFHPGCHRLEPYRGSTGPLPVTEDVAARVVILPTGTAVGPADIATICRIVELVVTSEDG